MERWQLYFKIIIFIIFSSFIIGIEFFYRKPLFDYSLIWIKNQQTSSSQVLMSFFKVISEFGTEPVLIPIVVLTYLFAPLNKAYLFLSVTILALVIDCIMKICYGSPRPYWIDKTLFKACDGGFGNPSGHSYTSTASYLTLAHILTDYDFFKKKIYMRLGVYFLFIGLIIAILLSRLFLGIHSINQILYGSLLGFALYFLYIHIFAMHKLSGQEFFRIFTELSLIIINLLLHLIILAISILVYFLVPNDTSPYDEIQNNLCPNLNLYRKFNNDGLYGCLTFLALIGSHYGILFLANILNLKNKNNLDVFLKWNSNNKLLNKLYIFLLMICFATPLILMLIISGKANLIIIYIFKVSIPYLLACFGIYGLNIYCSIKLKIANPLIIDSLVLNTVDGTNIKIKDNHEEKDVLQLKNINNNIENLA